MISPVNSIPSTGAVFGNAGENLSIMIPTYNCAAYLQYTLESLQEQGTGIADAEITIVDDVSTKDDPQACAERIWPARTEFVHHQKNIGVTANFNSCIHFAKRQWLHILHGDDVVLPGAYAELDQTARLFPQALAIFGRTVFMESRGFWKGTTPILGSEERGMLKYNPVEWASCPVQCAGVLISRQAVAEIGEFDPHFSHAADWNMWWRLAKTGRVAYTNRCIGGYRMFEGAHSSTLRRSGKNLQETIDQAKRVFADYPADADQRKFWEPMLNAVIRQCRSFMDDSQAFANNLAMLDEFPPGTVGWRIRGQLRNEHLRRNSTAA